MNSNEFFLNAIDFKDKRIKEISTGKKRFDITDGPKIVIHIIGRDFDDKSVNYDLSVEDAKLYEFRPLCSLNNVIGTSYSVFSAGIGNKCYAEYCPCGVIESIDTDILSPVDGKNIPIDLFKETISCCIINYIKIFQFLKVKLPIIVFITLIDAEDYFTSRCRRLFYFTMQKIILLHINAQKFL